MDDHEAALAQSAEQLAVAGERSVEDARPPAGERLGQLLRALPPIGPRDDREDDYVGPARGRALEQAFYRLCRFTGLRLTEQAGSRTLRGVSSASGLSHESDAVIVAADITVHVEMKSLFGEVPKHDLMLFNQKGMDFILADAPELRSRPCYRLFLTTSPVTPAARRFAAIWGIGLVERDRARGVVEGFLEVL